MCISLILRSNKSIKNYAILLKKGGNLMKVFRSFDAIFILAITLLFVYDYFPEIPYADAIPKRALLILILGLLLIRFGFKKREDRELKANIKWQMALTLYILILIVILPLLGGESSSGLSFDSGFLWVLILISLFDIYSKWKIVKRAESK